MFAIKQMREAAKMTQQEVADVLGIRKGRYGDWERGTREINLVDAARLADLFGCTLDELAGREWPRRDSSLTADENIVLDAMRSVQLIKSHGVARSRTTSHELPLFCISMHRVAPSSRS